MFCNIFNNKKPAPDRFSRFGLAFIQFLYGIFILCLGRKISLFKMPLTFKLSFRAGDNKTELPPQTLISPNKESISLKRLVFGFFLSTYYTVLKNIRRGTARSIQLSRSVFFSYSLFYLYIERTRILNTTISEIITIISIMVWAHLFKSYRYLCGFRCWKRMICSIVVLVKLVILNLAYRLDEIDKIFGSKKTICCC